MRKRLQLALMASPVIATFLSFSISTPSVQAETGSGSSEAISATTDDSGHKIYVNDVVTSLPARASRPFAPVARQSSLVFWSVTEHRWKPVPKANLRAARSAAAEVDRYLGKNSDGPRVADSDRGRSFSPADVEAAIGRAAARHNVDPALVRAVIKVESNFNPNAVSRKGAMGLMQLMPQTARQLNVTNPFDPDQNVDAGVRHLKQLMESYGGNIKLSLAAYNAGQGAVARSAGIPHFAETRNYVKRITELYNGGTGPEFRFLSQPVREPIRVQRDAQGALYFSNTD
jgi:soluble lytic murein transglycosylase-like protein